MTSRTFSRDEILEALRRLGSVLVERGIEGRLFVVGGAAIALAFSNDRATRDIDALVTPAKEVLDAASEVGENLGLPADWLSTAAVRFMPETSVENGRLVLDVPGLQVRTAPADVVLAMKLFAGRITQDAGDIAFLCGMLDISSVEQARILYDRYYPEHLDRFEKSRDLVEDVLEGNTDEVSGSGDDG